MPPNTDEVTRTLRRRILRAVRAGALKPGDRLPSGRHISTELQSSPRVVHAAYRLLADEGIVQLRERSGAYVAYDPARGSDGPALPEERVVDALAVGLAHEIAIMDFPDRVRRMVETVRLRVLVVASTSDQVKGLCRELEDDFGLQATGIEAVALGSDQLMRSTLRGIDLLVTTAANAGLAQRVSAEWSIPFVVAGVRLDLLRGEWRLLLREPVYVVVTDVRFVELLRRYFSGVPGAGNLRPIVLGEDDVLAVPVDATTYITRSAREVLGPAAIVGRALPPIRLLSSETAREIITFIVQANGAAQAALRKPRAAG